MKILINNLGRPLPIEDTGVHLPTHPYTIPPMDYALWANSKDILPWIELGTVVVGDGECLLGWHKGTRFLQDRPIQVYLGGTAVERSSWRHGIMPFLKSSNIDFVIPHMDQHLKDVQEDESDRRRACHRLVFWFTPKERYLNGAIAVHEASFRGSGEVIVGFSEEPGEGKFHLEQREELERVCEIVRDNGGIWAHDMETLHRILSTDITFGLTKSEITA